MSFTNTQEETRWPRQRRHWREAEGEAVRQHGAARVRELTQDHNCTAEKGHVSIGVREYWTVSDPAYLEYIDYTRKWPDLGCFAKVFAERRVGEETTYAQHALYLLLRLFRNSRGSPNM